ncbi:MAG TPA: hypothetical protein DCL45_04930 [Chloroflexi bacterium]|nr:hypothetical protein [Chloroflexota bacterium]
MSVPVAHRPRSTLATVLRIIVKRSAVAIQPSRVARIDLIRPDDPEGLPGASPRGCRMVSLNTADTDVIATGPLDRSWGCTLWFQFTYPRAVCAAG